MSTKVPKVDFRIKLLSGNNVVMVEAGGYESEIFVPLIVNGRIGFQNIIPNRRCCTPHGNQYNKNNSNVRCLQQLTPLRDLKQRQYALPSNLPSPTRPIRMSAGQDERPMPIAYSTPTTDAPGIAAAASGTQSSKNTTRRLHRRRSHLSISRSFCNTPEQPRRDMHSVYDVAKDTLVRIPSGIKVIRLYRSPTPTNAHKNVLRVVSTNTEYPGSCCQSVDLMQLPPSPIPTQTENTVPNEQEASEYRLPDTPDLKLRSKHKVTLSSDTTSATKWRKCITPIRTYSRRQLVQRHASTVNVNKKALNNSQARMRNRIVPTVRLGEKVLPSYMINPTQTAKSAVRVEVKKRRVIIDPKLNITPRTYKRQQRDTSDLKNNSKYRLPTSRKEYDASKLSAFEMLTNSNRMRNMSIKLNGQFRKCCVHKASSTNPRYKQLCNIPPLQLDQKSRDTSIQSCENTAPTRPSQSHVHRIQNMVAITRVKIPEPITAIK